MQQEMIPSDQINGGLDAGFQEAVQARIKHASDLIESARAVHVAGPPHISFHLAVLALEELGRRELFALQRVRAFDLVKCADTNIRAAVSRPTDAE